MDDIAEVAVPSSRSKRTRISEDLTNEVSEPPTKKSSRRFSEDNYDANDITQNSAKKAGKEEKPSRSTPRGQREKVNQSPEEEKSRSTRAEEEKSRSTRAAQKEATPEVRRSKRLG